MIQTWEEFVANEAIFSVNDGGRFTGGRELSILRTLASRRGAEKILDLSCAHGDTACWLAKTLPKAVVFAFDVARELGGKGFDHPRSNQILSLSTVGSAIKIAPEEIRSRIVLQVLNGCEIPGAVRDSGPYDFAYIDGQHTWRFVVEDTKLVLQAADAAAVIAWDDYWDHCPEVRHFIDLLNSRIGNVITLVEGSRLCYVELNEEIRGKTIEALGDL